MQDEFFALHIDCSGRIVTLLTQREVYRNAFGFAYFCYRFVERSNGILLCPAGQGKQEKGQYEKRLFEHDYRSDSNI